MQVVVYLGYILCIVCVSKKSYLSEISELTQVVVYSGGILYIVYMLEKSYLRVPKYSTNLYMWTKTSG
jgi:hypothetical protein